MLGSIWCTVAVSLWWLRWAAATEGLICREDRAGITKRCVANEPQDSTQVFYVDGYRLDVTFKEDELLRLQCEGNLTLDNPALPHFRVTHRLLNVKFIYCSLPAETYKQALETLNVHVLEHLEIEDHGELTAHHLTGLECSTGATTRCDTHRLEALALVKVQLSLDVFEAVPKLQRLRMENTHFDRLDRLPNTIKKLHFVNAYIHNLPISILSRFTNLDMLTVRDDEGSVRIEASDTIEQLSLEAQAVYIDTTSLPKSLKELKLVGWDERHPKSFKHCSALESLVLETITAEFLPDDWLIECRSLKSLSLEDAPSLTNVSKYALRGAQALASLELTETALETLPQGLLDDAIILTEIKLSRNKLQELPRSLFSRTKVESLDLSANSLDRHVLDRLSSALSTLQVLRLEDNVGLGDTCPESDGDHTRISKLSKFQNLRTLVLRNTSARVLCRDWARLMPHLVELDLSANGIAALAFSDIQFIGENRKEVIVNLFDNPVKSLQYTREDYYAMVHSYSEYCQAGGRRVSHARIKLSSILECDCNTLWAARAIQNCSNNVILEHAKCPGNIPLSKVSLQNLTCSKNCGVPANCQCARRDGDHDEILRVTCVNRSTFPKLPNKSGVVWELSLSNNYITELNAKDLPPNIQELDLRNNKLKHLSAEVLRVLPHRARLFLKGNKLSCDCDIAETLQTKLITDVPHLFLKNCGPCHSGSSTFANSALLPSLLTPLLVTAALVILCLSYPRTRRRFKKLLRNSFCPQPEPSNDLPYDVFLSYSHLDGDLVEELMKWLEKNEYRVCEHSRDWVPGGWIPAQITASVQRSRCTLVVVSKNFLHSKWARAEFREAYVAALHDTRPRLVVVLLEEPGILPLDKELRHYLENNTYALWTDRYFWNKLRTALPKPRPCEQITIESELTPTLDKEVP